MGYLSECEAGNPLAISPEIEIVEATAGNPWALLLDDGLLILSLLRVANFAPMSIGVEAVVSHGDLSLIGDMGGDPGYEFQIIHPLHLFGVFPILVADLTFFFFLDSF